MEMELPQLTQMVTWLDEERRRDRSELKQLLQRVEALSLEAQSQRESLQELEKKLSELKGVLARIGELEKSLENTKKEIMLIIQDYEEERRKATLESERLHQVERARLAKAIDDLRKEWELFRKMSEEINTCKAEEARLNEMVLALRDRFGAMEKALENVEHALAYTGERSDYLLKRVAQVQQENAGLLKRAGELESRFDYLAEQIQKLAKRLEEISLFQQNFRREQEQIGRAHV